MNQEEHNRIVNDGISKLKLAQPKKRSPEDEIIDRAMQVTTAMRAHIRPVLQAGGFTDEQGLRALITTLYLEAFTKAFSKDELVVLCTCLHVELAIENIRANPYDSANPDALSGV